MGTNTSFTYLSNLNSAYNMVAILNKIKNSDTKLCGVGDISWFSLIRAIIMN